MTRLLLLSSAVFFVAIPAQAQRFGGGDAASALLDKADANHDGVITRAEFAAARDARFDRMDRNHDGAVDMSDFGRLARFRPQAADRLRAMIGKADANGDGHLSRTELDAAPMPLFDRADTDHDGRLDKDEIAAARATAVAGKDEGL